MILRISGSIRLVAAGCRPAFTDSSDWADAGSTWPAKLFLKVVEDPWFNTSDVGQEA
jgi:hypothetical protein